jgi:predicted membrane protein
MINKAIYYFFFAIFTILMVIGFMFFTVLSAAIIVIALISGAIFIAINKRQIQKVQAEFHSENVREAEYIEINPRKEEKKEG